MTAPKTTRPLPALVDALSTVALGVGLLAFVVLMLVIMFAPTLGWTS